MSLISPGSKLMENFQLMPASEARRISDEKQSEKLEQARNRVIEIIQRAVNNGDYDVTLNYHIRDEIKKELEQLGYKVKRDTYTYDNVTVISWEEEKE